MRKCIVYNGRLLPDIMPLWNSIESNEVFADYVPPAWLNVSRHSPPNIILLTLCDK